MNPLSRDSAKPYPLQLRDLPPYAVGSLYFLIAITYQRTLSQKAPRSQRPDSACHGPRTWDHPKIVLEFSQFPRAFPGLHAASADYRLPSAMICGRGSLLIIAIIVATIYSSRTLLQSAELCRSNLERNELSGERRRQRQREIAT